VSHYVWETDSVGETAYVSSPEAGHPSRLFVLFEAEVDELSEAFQGWLLEERVVVVNVGFESDAVLDRLFVELQDVDVVA
jgi:hypothetical protein